MPEWMALDEWMSLSRRRLFLALIVCLLEVQHGCAAFCKREFLHTTEYPSPPSTCDELHAPHENGTVILNPAVLSNAVVNFGRLSLNTSGKLNSSTCLIVLAIGGSVTCGKTLNHNHTVK
jgi:hypothetical protein